MAIVGIWLFKFIICIDLGNKKDLFVLFWGLVFFVLFCGLDRDYDALLQELSHVVTKSVGVTCGVGPRPMREAL